MSYNQLYDAWMNEKNHRDLQPLKKTFYAKLGQYVKKAVEELHTMDDTAKMAQIIREEVRNAKKMISDIVLLRYKKILRNTMDDMPISSEILTIEEEILSDYIFSSKKILDDIISALLNGRVPQIQTEKKERPKKILVRFLEAIPAIVGPNMEVYGAFEAEDIALIPFQNAQILIQNGLAVRIDIP